MTGSGESTPAHGISAALEDLRDHFNSVLSRPFITKSNYEVIAMPHRRRGSWPKLAVRTRLP
jgi:hypothetical protein